MSRQLIWSVFLDISKALEKAQHKGFIFKFKQNSILGNLLSTFKVGKQRVIQFILWSNIKASILQRSIIGSLLFMININNVSERFATNSRLFADDIFHICVVDNINLSVNNLHNDLSKVTARTARSFQPDTKTQAQEVLFSPKIKQLSHQ